MEPGGCQNRSKIDIRSRLRRGCVWGRSWGLERSRGQARLGPFWEPFSIKNRQNGIQKIIKKSMPKKYPKMMPEGSKMDGKWIQNASRNHKQIDTKVDAEKVMNI